MVCVYIYTWYLGVWIPACSAGCLEHFRHRARDGFVSVHVVSVSGGRQGRQKTRSQHDIDGEATTPYDLAQANLTSLANDMT